MRHQQPTAPRLVNRRPIDQSPSNYLAVWATSPWIASLLGVMCLVGLSGTAVRCVANDADELRLNQIQVIGTHNSYHLAPPPALLKWIALSGKSNSTAFDYSHRPLAEQLGALRIRQVELDVFADPLGGHYANPAFRRILVDQRQAAGPDPNADGVLESPGLKVLHVQDIDYLSTTPTFRIALRQLRDWSRLNPRHAPILVLVELKDEVHALLPTKPIKFDRERIDEVDREIRAEFSPRELFVPDDLRGDHPTLPEAIRARGWPRLADARGKVLFALDNEDAIRDLYLDGHPALRGRVMFASVPEDHAAAAWFKINDAARDFDRIQRLVRSGYVVRTRADTSTQEARRNDTARRDRALASGAQWVSTDFPEPRREWSTYHVRFDGPDDFRRNPVSAP